MNRAQLFTLAALAMFASGYASATTIDFQGLDPARSASVWMDFTYLPGDTMLDGQTASAETKVTEQIGVGVLNLSFDGSLQLQDAFCLDRFNYISSGNYTVNLSAPNVVNNGEQAAWMLHEVLPLINAAPNATEQGNLAAALQLAIWDVVHDNGDGFSQGRIQMSSDPANVTDPIILNLAQSFITASVGNAYIHAVVISNVNADALTQRLIVDRPGDGVPEPSTWAMALTGLALAGLGRLKRS
jgi:hypothetical protein